MANRQPREVALQRLDITGKTTSDLPGVPGPAADSLSASIKGFESLSTQLNGWADKAAVTEANDAGTADALQSGGRVALRRDGTLSGEAYDKAAASVSAAVLETSARRLIAEAYDANKANPDALKAKLVEERDKLTAEIGDPTVQAVVSKKFDDLSFSFERAALRERDRDTFAAARGGRIETIDAALTSAKRAAFVTGGDAVGDKNLAVETGRIRTMVANAVEQGDYTADEGARILRGHNAAMASQKALGVFSRLPDVESKVDFRREIDAARTKGEGVLAGLPTDTLDQMLRTMDSEIAVQRNERTRIEQRAASATTEQGYGLAAEGKLTVDWLDANRSRLSDATYRTLSRATIEPANAETDPVIYSDLMSRAIRAPSGVSRDAVDEYSRGKLMRGALDRVSMLAQMSKDDAAARPWANEIRYDMLTRLQPGPSQPPAEAVRQIDAVFTFNDWLKANPEATPDAARERADVLIDQSNTAAAKNEKAKLRLPRFSPVSRDEVTPETLTAIGQRAREARETGRISRQDFDDEVELMRRWADVLMRDKSKRAR